MSIKIKLVDPDQTKPHTWDVADAITDEHWTASQVFAFIRSRLTDLPEVLPEPPVKKNNEVKTPEQKVDPDKTILENLTGIDNFKELFIGDNFEGFNMSKIAKRIIDDEILICEGGVFYRYNKSTGVYDVIDDELLLVLIHEKVESWIDKIPTYFLSEVIKLKKKLNRNFYLDVKLHLNAGARKPGCFESNPALPRVHCKNTMLFLENGKWIQKPFSPGYYSRNQIPFDYIPGAKCERFENEVLIRNLDPEDADLLQLYAGQVLLGYNYAQKFIIIHGVAKSSKSTFLNILKGIVGQSNTAELRTWLLNERFETSRFIGKQLLYGADVPGDFLNCEGASAIKRLTGGDEIETEHKGRNATVIIKGCFNVVIVSNSRLVVMMDGDKTPWQRRLILIDFPKPITSSPIPNFDKLLIETEGSGILNWMLAGAEKLMTDIKEGRGFVMTPEQIERVENLLYESDSVRAFAREKIVVCQNADVSTEEISTAYVDFCENKGWDAIPQRKFETSIPDAMLELYRISKSSNLTRNGKRCRGYVGVRIRSNNPEMQEQETEW